MVSNIDPTKPAPPIAYTVDMRNNFAAAKTEIETLQSTVSLSSGMLKSMPIPADNRVAFCGDSITIAANVMNSVAVIASGGTGPYSYSVTGVPTGITSATASGALYFSELSPNNSGVPTTLVTVTATDSIGASGTQNYNISLAPQSMVFTLTPTGSATGTLLLAISSFNHSINNRGAQFWVPFLTDQQIVSAPELNFGRGGDTTTTLLARISDAVNAACGSYVVMIGVNDLNNTGSPSISTIKSNLTTIWQTLLATGRPVVACTILPRSLTVGSNDNARAMLWTLNKWIRLQRGTIPGLYIVDSAPDYGDPFSVASSPFIGAIVSGTASDYDYSYDGLHPKAIGAFHAFRKIARTLSMIYGAVDIPVAGISDTYNATYNTTGNLLTNGVMSFTAGTGTVVARCNVGGSTAPDNWQLSSADGNGSSLAFTGVGTASTFSDGTTPAAQVTISGTAIGGVSTQIFFSQSLAGSLNNFLAGDKLQLSCRVELDGGSIHLTPPYCLLSYTDNNGTVHNRSAGTTGALHPSVADASPLEATAGTLITPISRPLSGTLTALSVTIGIYITNNTSVVNVSGLLKIGAVALRKV